VKVYIAGPMTGRQYYNLHAFEKAQREWRLRGHEASTPFEHNNVVWRRVYGRDFDPAADRCDYGDPMLADMFAEDIAGLCRADAIVLLDGWRDSRGARVELHTATALGKRVFLADGTELDVRVTAHFDVDEVAA
jgi:hypothetical protein